MRGPNPRASRNLLGLEGKLPTPDHGSIGLDDDDHAWPTLPGEFLSVSYRQVLAQEMMPRRVADDVDGPSGESGRLNPEDFRLVSSTGRR